MTNKGLEQLLKIAKIPEREKSFWEDFPKSVTRKLGRNSLSEKTTQPSSKFNFAFWGIGLATACLVVGFWFGFRNGHSRGTEEQIAAARKYFQEIESLFPNQVRAIVFENGESRLLLSDKADVPTSSPLFVKICSGEKCRSLITFSGQQIQIDGEPFEVLSNARGQIFLVGNESIWSSDEPGELNKRIIQAQPLQL